MTASAMSGAERLRQMTFVLAGFGSEYSLHRLAGYLQSNGFRVVGGDMQEAPLPTEIAGPVVFASSQHIARSSPVFRGYYGQSPPYANYVGPLEIMQRLKPACSVFVPHDLEMPILAEELAFMGAFDLYCAPFPDSNPSLGHACRVIDTGWIKHNLMDQLPEAVEVMVRESGIFFVNQVSAAMRNGGARTLIKEYPSIVTDRIPVKLPVWPGCDTMGTELAALGAMVLDSSLSSTKLIAASKQVCVNAPGSVVAEARYLGVPAYLVEPGDNRLRALFDTSTAKIHGPFDFELLLESIVAHLERNR